MSGIVFYILGIFTFNVTFYSHNKHMRWNYYSFMLMRKLRDRKVKSPAQGSTARSGRARDWTKAIWFRAHHLNHYALATLSEGLWEIQNFVPDLQNQDLDFKRSQLVLVHIAVQGDEMRITLCEMLTLHKFAIKWKLYSLVSNLKCFMLLANFIGGLLWVAQLVKNLPAVQETLAWFLGWEDLLKKG